MSTRRSLPLIRTKPHRPPVTEEIVCRKRLHKVMDRAFELPPTLVSAPAGYGKSTLVSHWAESLDEPCAWLSLDPGDSDLEMFISYLLAAIESVVPDACPETRALATATNPVPLTILGGSLVNELDALDSPLVLVLDDYHHIEPGSSVHEFLWFLLEHPPRCLRLVLETPQRSAVLDRFAAWTRPPHGGPSPGSPVHRLDQLDSMLVEDPAHDSIRGEISLCRGYVLFFMGERVDSLKHITVVLERIPVSCTEARTQSEVIFALSSQMVGREQQAGHTLGGLLVHCDSPAAQGAPCCSTGSASNGRNQELRRWKIATEGTVGAAC